MVTDEESPYPVRVWKFIPAPESGAFFRVGDMVRTRGPRGLLCEVRAVVLTAHPDVVVDIEYLTVSWIEDGLSLSQVVRAQEFDLIERAAPANSESRGAQGTA